MYRETFSKVMTYFTEGSYEKEVESAKAEYFDRTGKVFESDALYESRMTAFLEWYVLDRKLDGLGVPPIRLYILLFGKKISKDELAVLKGLQDSFHGTFTVMGGKKSQVRIKDIFTGNAYNIIERRSHVALGEGEIVDARLIGIDGTHYFNDSITAHPPEAKPFIQNELKRRKKLKEANLSEFLMDLAFMRLKRERYKHVEIGEIYKWEN